jgi:hypothetical protein
LSLAGEKVPGGNGTLSRTLVTGLPGVYTGIATLATRVLPFSSPVAASTLVIAASINPLRHRVQRGSTSAMTRRQP